MDQDSVTISGTESRIGRTVRNHMAKAKKPTEKRVTKPRRAAAAGPHRLYTLDVSLFDGSRPRKWTKKKQSVVRTIQIRGDQTLEQLHDAIFDAFDRYDEHMYEFQMGQGPMDQDGSTYVLPEADDGDPQVLGTVDQTTIDSMGLEVGRQFGYWFDFGDDWHHQIGVVAIDEGPAEGKYPQVIKSVGESPPQYPDDEDEDDYED